MDATIACHLSLLLPIIVHRGSSLHTQVACRAESPSSDGGLLGAEILPTDYACELLA